MASYKPKNLSQEDMKRGYHVTKVTIMGREVEVMNCNLCQFDTIIKEPTPPKKVPPIIEHVKKGIHPWAFEPDLPESEQPTGGN